MSSVHVSVTQPSSTLPVTKYGDFARSVNDFFAKDFPSGIVRVEARTQSRNLLALRPGSKAECFSDEFKAVASRDLATGSVFAEVKNTSNFAISKGRMDLKSVTTLASNNALTQQLVLNNPVLQGLKFDLTSSLEPSGSSKAKTTIEIDQGVFLSSTTFDVLRGPLFTTEIATRFRDLQLGGEIGYNVAKGSLDKYSLALSFDRAREKAILQAHTGFRAFTASYYQKFNDQLEVAYRANWNTKLANLSMEVGAKWYLVGGGFLKAKLDNAGRLGLALSSELRQGLQVVLGATVDTAKLQENNHKLGLELTYSA